jgi:hypothetical protein
VDDISQLELALKKSTAALLHFVAPCRRRLSILEVALVLDTGAVIVVVRLPAFIR